MLRYLRRLQAHDFALDRGMIPLGSCTMKLNATAEMMPITCPVRRPPPVRAGQDAAGYRQLVASSRAGWPRSPATTAVSLQPNAGTQGEYAGLLAIRS